MSVLRLVLQSARNEDGLRSDGRSAGVLCAFIRSLDVMLVTDRQNSCHGRDIIQWISSLATSSQEAHASHTRANDVINTRMEFADISHVTT
jgi:hypothetical protein